MFLYLVIFFSLGILLQIYLLFTSKYIIISAFYMFVMIYVLFTYIIRIDNKKIIITVLSFIVGGCYFYIYYSSFNNSNMLQNKISYASFNGTISYVEKNSSSNKQYVYIKNIVMQNNISIKYLKLTYRGGKNLLLGDKVEVIADLYPISKTLSPKGFNFYKFSYLKKIGSSGFIRKIKIKQKAPKRNILSKIKQHKETLLNKFNNNIYKNSNNKESALFLQAITIGGNKFLPKDKLDSLRKAGLSHYIVISGYHIGVIIFLLFTFLFNGLFFINHKMFIKYDVRKIVSLITIIILFIYLFILWGNLPATRAIFMGILLLSSYMLGFNAISINSLFLSGLIIILINPYAIMSASFLLSFFATLGIFVLLNSSIMSYIQHKKNNSRIFYYLNPIILLILMNLFVQIFIFPIVAFFFGRVPILSVFANMIVSPIFAFILYPFLMLYLLLPSVIGVYFLHVAELAMESIFYIAEVFTNFDYSFFTVKFIPFYTLFATLLFYIYYGVSNYKYKNIIFIGFTIMFLFSYSSLLKNPWLMIDYKMSLIAIESENNFIMHYDGKNYNSFIANIWVRNPNSNIIKMSDSDKFVCNTNAECFSDYFNKSIAIIKKEESILNYCNKSEILIYKGVFPTKYNGLCNSFIIDIPYLKQYGSYFLS